MIYSLVLLIPCIINIALTYLIIQLLATTFILHNALVQENSYNTESWSRLSTFVYLI